MVKLNNYKKLNIQLLLIKKIINYRNNDQNFPAAHFFSFFCSLYYNESDKNVKAVKIKLGLLLCWFGIHRYKVIDISFGFAAGDSVRTIECKICGIKKIKKE
jgi:hypothetical protein